MATVAVDVRDEAADRLDGHVVPDERRALARGLVDAYDQRVAARIDGGDRPLQEDAEEVVVLVSRRCHGRDQSRAGESAERGDQPDEPHGRASPDRGP